MYLAVSCSCLLLAIVAAAGEGPDVQPKGDPAPLRPKGDVAQPRPKGYPAQKSVWPLGASQQSIWPALTSLVSTSLDLVEGRGKQKGGNHGMVMMGGMMMALGLAGLAALAGKALAASMAALMLAAVSLMKKGGGGEHHHSTYEVVTVPHGGGHGGHHHRSIAEGESISPALHYVTSYGGASYDTSAEAQLPHPVYKREPKA